jgi:ABC-type Fe3+ transport system substrate-binding protein
MNGKLIAPEVVAASAWRAGAPKLNTPGREAGLPSDFKCSFQTAEWVMTDLFVNTSVVKPGEINSWKDLLKPQYKGKIAAYDPRRSGPGQTPVGYLAALFGHDYLKQLYALVQFAIETFRKQGLPIERVYPADGQGSVTGGFSVVMLIKNAPHPNAAQVFANWFGTKEAQILYETQMMETSMRTDVTGTNLPDYVRPKPGVAYPVDDYSYEHFHKIRMPAVEMLQKELQR